MAGLGAYHGLNPAMGWLFAVGIGLQERSRRAVLRSLAPIALGHELAIAVIALLVVVLGVVSDAGPLRMGAAVVLIAFGIFRFARPRAHPRWSKTMRVNRRELAWWSFLMSSAHGAGLMVAPVLVGASAAGGGHEHSELAGSIPELAAVLVVHVGAMVLAMGVVAVVVYERLGVSVLRRAWLNTDHVWAGAFVAAGAFTLVT
jgi:hypothetical protein